MKNTNVLRGLLSVGMLAGAVAWTSGDASAAEHLLLVRGLNAANCGAPDGAYWFEAWGYDSGGNIVCEAAEITEPNGLAGTECSAKFGINAAVKHASFLTVRNSSNYSYIRTVAQTGQVSWATQTQQINYSCPGGTITVYSQGFDTST